MRTLNDRQREQDLADQDDRSLTSRSDKKRVRVAEETALKQLAARLLTLASKQLEQLDLSEPLLQAVFDGQRVTSPIAKRRAIRRIRAELRAGDAESIRDQLDVQAAPPVDAALVWRRRLLIEADTALAEFFQAHPDTDRQQLRQLIRETLKATHGSPQAARLEKRLLLVIRQAIQ